MNNFLAAIGQAVLSILNSLGALTILTGRTLGSMRDFHWGRVLYQASRLGVDSLLIVSTISLFTGMVMTFQLAAEFIKYGAQNVVGAVVFIAIGRELGPVLTGVTVAGRVGAAITAEIGSMKVTEQLDALEVMATPPISYLVLPRVIACMIMMPILIGFSDAIGTYGGYFVASNYNGITGQMFYTSIQDFAEISDLTAGLIKGFFFGGIIALVGCYKGMTARSGAEGVGVATTQSVVMSIILIFISNYFLSLFLF
jgi:conserved hypothetical integral membrane protein